MAAEPDRKGEAELATREKASETLCTKPETVPDFPVSLACNPLKSLDSGK